MLLTGDQPGRV